MGPKLSHIILFLREGSEGQVLESHFMSEEMESGNSRDLQQTMSNYLSSIFSEMQKIIWQKMRCLTVSLGSRVPQAFAPCHLTLGGRDTPSGPIAMDSPP